MAYSKPIKNNEDEPIQLIIDTLHGKDAYWLSADSIFLHKTKGWTIVEFLKCDNIRPHESSPNRNWQRSWRKVNALWTLTQALKGNLYWVTFEHSREQFSILHVTSVEKDTGMSFSRINTNFDGFKKWYNELNENSAPELQ